MRGNEHQKVRRDTSSVAWVSGQNLQRSNKYRKLTGIKMTAQGFDHRPAAPEGSQGSPSAGQIVASGFGNEQRSTLMHRHHVLISIKSAHLTGAV